MPESDTILHNDLHPGNIMIQDGEFVLIDLADVTVGPKAFDPAAIYRDMIAGARTQPDVTEKSQGMKVDMVEQVGQLFFVKYTGITAPMRLRSTSERWVCCLLSIRYFSAEPGSLPQKLSRRI